MIAAIGKEAEQTKQFIRETCCLEVHQTSRTHGLKDTRVKKYDSMKELPENENKKKQAREGTGLLRK